MLLPANTRAFEARCGSGRVRPVGAQPAYSTGFIDATLSPSFPQIRALSPYRCGTGPVAPHTILPHGPMPHWHIPLPVPLSARSIGLHLGSKRLRNHLEHKHRRMPSPLPSAPISLLFLLLFLVSLHNPTHPPRKSVLGLPQPPLQSHPSHSHSHSPTAPARQMPVHTVRLLFFFFFLSSSSSVARAGCTRRSSVGTGALCATRSSWRVRRRLCARTSTAASPRWRTHWAQARALPPALLGVAPAWPWPWRAAVGVREGVGAGGASKPCWPPVGCQSSCNRSHNRFQRQQRPRAPSRSSRPSVRPTRRSRTRFSSNPYCPLISRPSSVLNL